MKQTIIYGALILNLLLVFTACEKVNYEVISNFNVRLASSQTFDAEQVNLDIEQVKVNFTDTAWVLLNTPRQVYNLLEYRNGVDTSIAAGELPATSVVKKIKLVFGPNNSINVNGKFVPLILSEGSSELILKVDKKLNKFNEKVTVIFNPAQSISHNNDGQYQLKPVAVLQ